MRIIELTDALSFNKLDHLDALIQISYHSSYRNTRISSMDNQMPIGHDCVYRFLGLVSTKPVAAQSG